MLSSQAGNTGREPGMRRRRQTTALLAVLVLSCQSPREPVDPDPGGLELDLGLEPLQLGGRRRPHLWVGAREIRDRLGPTSPIQLDHDYLLRFVPLALSDKVESTLIETYLRVGGEEVLLTADRPRPLGPGSGFEEAAAALTRPVEVRLDGYRGRSVELFWRLADGGQNPIRAFIANPKLLASAPAGDSRPDVLLVCSDTHRYDYALGPKGGDLMPQLRRLQRDSVVYRRAFSTASWTMPAIASLLTGLFPRLHLTGQRIGSVPSEEFRPEDLPPGQFGFDVRPTTRILSAFPEQIETLSERLRLAGYETALVVSNPLYTLSGIAFDGIELAVDVGVAPFEQVLQATFELLDQMPADRPLFLLVHFMDVHQWSDWYFEKSYPDLDRSQAPAEVQSSYAAAVRATDGALGELLGEWEARRGLKDALVVFFSDHGEQLLDAPEAPRLGHGNSMAEELLRVPLLVHYPARYARRAETVDTPVSLVDLPPTVLDVAGLPFDLEGLSGRSLLRLNTDPAERFIFADFQIYGQDLASVRRGGHKLVLHLDTSELELVDVATPGAGTALEVDSPAGRELRRAWLAYVDRAARATEGLESSRQVDHEEVRRQLEALGYLR